MASTAGAGAVNEPEPEMMAPSQEKINSTYGATDSAAAATASAPKKNIFFSENRQKAEQEAAAALLERQQKGVMLVKVHGRGSAASHNCGETKTRTWLTLGGRAVLVPRNGTVKDLRRAILALDVSGAFVFDVSGALKFSTSKVSQDVGTFFGEEFTMYLGYDVNRNRGCGDAVCDYGFSGCKSCGPEKKDLAVLKGGFRSLKEVGVSDGCAVTIEKRDRSTAVLIVVVLLALVIGAINGSIDMSINGWDKINPDRRDWQAVGKRLGILDNTPALRPGWLPILLVAILLIRALCVHCCCNRSSDKGKGETDELKTGDEKTDAGGGKMSESDKNVDAQAV